MNSGSAIKATIITICRNEADSIRQTIESVLSQTYEDFEYIVIDGASSDGTAEIIASYAERLAYWVSEKDSGIYAAMNKGIRKARGEYLLFLNGGDSLFSADVLSRVFNLGRSEDILYGDMMKAKDGEQYLSSLAGYSDKPFFLFTHTLPHQGSFIKSSLFETLGLYDESYRLMGDYEFFKRAIVTNRASSYYLGFVIGVFDYSGMSTMAEFKGLQRREARRARRETYGLLRFLVFSLVWGVYDLVLYRPRRKLLSLLGRS